VLVVFIKKLQININIFLKQQLQVPKIGGREAFVHEPAMKGKVPLLRLQVVCFALGVGEKFDGER